MEAVSYRPLGTPHVALIHTGGQVRGPASCELRDVVRHLGHQGTGWMVFDCRLIVTLDSMALGALLLARALCTRRGGQAVLLGPSPALRALFEALHVGDLFAMVDDAADPVAALHRAGVPAEAEG